MMETIVLRLTREARKGETHRKRVMEDKGWIGTYILADDYNRKKHTTVTRLVTQCPVQLLSPDLSHNVQRFSPNLSHNKQSN